MGSTGRVEQGKSGYNKALHLYQAVGGDELKMNIWIVKSPYLLSPRVSFLVSSNECEALGGRSVPVLIHFTSGRRSCELDSAFRQRRFSISLILSLSQRRGPPALCYACISNSLSPARKETKGLGIIIRWWESRMTWNEEGNGLCIPVCDRALFHLR